MSDEKLQGAVHTTKSHAIEFRDLNGEVTKTLTLDELETNTEHLLFALFFNQMEQLHHLRIMSATTVTTLQLQTEIHEAMKKGSPDIDDVMGKAMKHVETIIGTRMGISRSVDRG